MSTNTETQYKHLEPRPGSNYRQWFIKGRKIRAAVVYGIVNGDEPRTPEEFAADFEVPLEAVLEALDYAAKNGDVIHQDWLREGDWLRERGFLDGPAEE